MDEHSDSELVWDEVVDVICVGDSPGVVAYAICCAAADLDVLRVDPPVEPDEHTAAWYAAMTEDLTGGEQPAFSFARLTAAPERVGKRVGVEPFIGDHLRQWSAHCARSPFGVMFTQVPDVLVPMRTEDGQSVTAAFVGPWHGRGANLATWLSDRAAEVGLREPDDALTALVVEGGRIAGVQLDDGSLIAATGGLAFSANDATGRHPTPPDSAGDDLTAAILGRPAGRFATLDLLRR
jgi:hypothetical protein